MVGRTLALESNHLKIGSEKTPRETLADLGYATRYLWILFPRL